jgi:phosphoesterase RecJ-like protein
MSNENGQAIWNDTARVHQLLRVKGRKIAILIHVNPDGDAVGSAFGLARVLVNMGHDCKVISPNSVPGFLQWMPGYDNMVIYEEQPEAAVSAAGSSDMIIALDFNNMGRIKHFDKLVFPPDALIMMIDHHPDPDDFAHCVISDTSCSSTAELVYSFVKKEGLAEYIDREVATCIFAGIMTDTGCFSYNSSGSGTYLAVAGLLGYGIDKDRIYALVYDNFSAERMKMLGYALHQKMEIIPELHTAFIWLTLAELEEYDFKPGDTEGFVNFLFPFQGSLSPHSLWKRMTI